MFHRYCPGRRACYLPGMQTFPERARVVATIEPGQRSVVAAPSGAGQRVDFVLKVLTSGVLFDGIGDGCSAVVCADGERLGEVVCWSDVELVQRPIDSCIRRLSSPLPWESVGSYRDATNLPEQDENQLSVFGVADTEARVLPAAAITVEHAGKVEVEVCNRTVHSFELVASRWMPNAHGHSPMVTYSGAASALGRLLAATEALDAFEVSLRFAMRSFAVKSGAEQDDLNALRWASWCIRDAFRSLAAYAWADPAHVPLPQRLTFENIATCPEAFLAVLGDAYAAWYSFDRSSLKSLERRLARVRQLKIATSTVRSEAERFLGLADDLFTRLDTGLFILGVLQRATRRKQHEEQWDAEEIEAEKQAMNDL